MDSKAHVKRKIIGGGLLAAIGLSALSPVQQAGVALSVVGAAMWATPALASLTIPGVGIVIKCYCSPPPKGKSIWAIVAPSDADGVVRISGLTPARYEVKLFGDSKPIMIDVGKDGKLAFAARRDVKGGPSPRSTDPRARRAMPVMQEWVEPIAFGEEGGSGTIIAIATAAQMPDVNASTAEELMAGTNITREAAAFIIEDRKRGGPYKDPLDFAQRVGGSVTVDFGYSSARIGDTTIIARGNNPKSPGFKMVKGSGVVELYGKKHNYVGHVTLLR